MQRCVLLHIFEATYACFSPFEKKDPPKMVVYMLFTERVRKAHDPLN